MRLVFAGTPAVALPSLRLLLDAPGHEVVAVVTRPAAPAGRGRRAAGSPVAALAEQHGVPVLSPAKPGEPGFVERLTALAPDACPVVAYGALVPQRVLDIPVHGWVNLHFSLLPAWRGAAPVPHAILHGDEVTGAAAFRLEAGLDTGPVFGVVTEPIGPTDTAGDLLGRLAESGARLLLATLDGIAAGTLVAEPQPADGVSLAPKITVADAEVDWTAPARHVDRLVRACTPAPGAWTTFRGERLKLGPVRPPREPGPGEAEAAGSRPSGSAVEPGPGELRAGRSGVSVGTATGVVELGWVQPPGKRPMPAADWARGARLTPGERLG